jgi:hypothetical protein
MICRLKTTEYINFSEKHLRKHNNQPQTVYVFQETKISFQKHGYIQSLSFTQIITLSLIM